MFFNYVELNDDIIQIIDTILLYLGRQNPEKCSCMYYDNDTNIHILCEWLNSEITYGVSFWTNKTKDEYIKTINNKKYISRKVIPILINIYNNISQEVINDKIRDLEKEKKNDALLNKTRNLRVLCNVIQEYEDEYIKVSANTHRRRNDNYDYNDVVVGYKITLSNGVVVFDYSLDNIKTYKDGEWVKYFRSIKTNRFASDEERQEYINELLENEKKYIEVRSVYNSNRFDYFDFGSMEKNKYVLKNKIKVKKREFID